MFLPAAGYPLSDFTPTYPQALPPAPIILADKFDPKTGDICSLVEGVDPTDAAIYWQFTIQQGSGAALGTNGNRLHLVTKGTDGAPIQIEDEGRRVLAKFIERGDLEDVSVIGAVLGGHTATKALEVAATNVHTQGRPTVLIGGE